MNKRSRQKSAPKSKRKSAARRSRIELNTSIVKVKQRSLLFGEIERNIGIDKRGNGNLRILEGRIGGGTLRIVQVTLKKHSIINEGRIGGGGFGEI